MRSHVWTLVTRYYIYNAAKTKETKKERNQAQCANHRKNFASLTVEQVNRLSSQILREPATKLYMRGFPYPVHTGQYRVRG